MTIAIICKKNIFYSYYLPEKLNKIFFTLDNLNILDMFMWQLDLYCLSGLFTTDKC